MARFCVKDSLPPLPRPRMPVIASAPAIAADCLPIKPSATPTLVRAPATLKSFVATKPVKTSGSIQWKLRATHAPILPITVIISSRALPIETSPLVNSGDLNLSRNERNTCRIVGSSTSYACIKLSVSCDVTCAQSPLVVFCLTRANSAEIPCEPRLWAVRLRNWS